MNPQDHAILAEKGISENQLRTQLACFQTGFPFLRPTAAASVGNGVILIKEELKPIYLEAWNEYATKNHQIVKFVPASGAASRMFKDLFDFLNATYEVPTTKFEQTFFDQITKFAFYDALNHCCFQRYQLYVETLIEKGEYKKIVSTLLSDEGLNYGSLPKGLLLFHSYSPLDEEGVRTPFDEHLVEGALYSTNNNGEVHLHFTVSKEHQTLFEKLLENCQSYYEERFGVTYVVTFSTQKSNTDTIAVDEQNNPFRVDGKMLFRPGGHGALIENLNDLDADVVFVKNIDNVVQAWMEEDTVTYKKLLAGVLVLVQEEIFDYLRLLNSGKQTPEEVRNIIHFVQNTLCCKNPETKVLEDAELVLYLKRKLNRPIRVCGMVKNVGEPGGGPFLVENPDGTISPQILESSQIDLTDPASKAIFDKSTHFNPVDLVCGLKDYTGKKFNLLDFVDPQTGFISKKSKDGAVLKALELPGLWNGAMSDWNTILVEVPLTTFNPVKTVTDLLRPAHQC